jgi:hypothetical protein
MDVASPESRRSTARFYFLTNSFKPASPGTTEWTISLSASLYSTMLRESDIMLSPDSEKEKEAEGGGFGPSAYINGSAVSRASHA